MAGAGSFPKSSGDVVYQADYNAIQSLIASVKTTYYGVNCVSGQLSGNPVIDHGTLNDILTDINDCLTHQTGSGSGLSTLSAGSVIGHSDYNSLYNNANTAYTNRNNVYASSQLAQVANAATSNHNGGISPWNGTISHQVTVNFASANAANYFFQTGGYLYATASYTGSTGAQIDYNWATIIGAIGNKVYDLTSWNAGGTVSIATVHGSGYYVYSGSYWNLSVTKTSSTQVVMTMTFVESDSNHGGQYVSLNITSAVGYYKSVSSIVGTYPNSISTSHAL
jgi:hypothetical protein